MQDKYAGQAGTFVNDPETGERKPIDEVEVPVAVKPVPTKVVTKPKQDEVNESVS